jgi:hypothetical protein
VSHKSISESLELVRLAETRWGPKHRWHCVYCGRGAGMVVDHFVPSRLGGTNEVRNLVPACDRCNGAKSDRPPTAWMTAVGVPASRRLRLRRVVSRPDWVAPPDLVITRITLDYAAGRHVPRPGGPVQGEKGE